MTISFRTRLFVVASLIVATVLTSVMFVGWSRVLAFEVGRLDERLCLEARGLQSKRPRGGAPRDFSLDPARIEADIAKKLRVTSGAQLMLTLYGDAQLLQQLFNNLISNATQYCQPSGWIDISATRVPSGIAVVFANATSVITETERQRFFERFYRGDPSRQRDLDGIGLGLSLAREIVRAHGGEMTLEQSPLDQVRLHIILAQSIS